jgi:hypothetical protein
MTSPILTWNKGRLVDPAEVQILAGKRMAVFPNPEPVARRGARASRNELAQVLVLSRENNI